MIKTRYGEFSVSKYTKEVRENDRVKIVITETDRKFKDDIENFIKDLGKFETYMNGIYFLLNPILKSSNPPYDLIHTDIESSDITETNNGKILIIFITAKTEENTNFDKELNSQVIEKMIENIEKYYSLTNTLELFRDEILKGK